MESDEKDVGNLEQVVAAGDAWLRKYGVVSPIAHNNIVLTLRTAFDPVVKNLEYYIDQDNEKRRIDLTLHVDIKEMLLYKKPIIRKMSKIIPKMGMFIPKVGMFFKTDKVKELLDVLPNSDMPVFKEQKELLIDDVRELLGEYLYGYHITIRINRYEEKS